MAQPLDEQTDEELEIRTGARPLDERKAAIAKEVLTRRWREKSEKIKGSYGWLGPWSGRRAGSHSHQEVAEENLNAASPTVPRAAQETELFESCLVKVQSFSEAKMLNFVIAILATFSLAGCGAPGTPEFIQKVAMSDMYEVQARNLTAEEKASRWEAIQSSNW